MEAAARDLVKLSRLVVAKGKRGRQKRPDEPRAAVASAVPTSSVEVAAESVSKLSRRLLMAVALAASFLLVALDLGMDHYGSTLDELTYFGAARRHVNWLGKLGQPGALSAETLQEHFGWKPEIVIHPTFSRWCSGISWLVIHRWLGGDEIVALRLHNAVAFALIAWGVAGFLLPRYGLTSAIVGLLLVWGDVRLFGHAHSGQTDLVLSCVWLWAVLLAGRGIYDGSRWALAGSVIVAGFALATKMTGVLLVGVLAAWPVWALGWRGSRMSLAFLLVPPLVFYALNPQSWQHPIEWTSQWFATFRAREKEILIPTLFLGKQYEFRAPWYAAPIHGVITIPPAILLLAVVAGIVAARRLWQSSWQGRWDEARSLWCLFAVAAAVPLVACMMPGVPNHDLERLFLPLQPLLIIGAGYGFYTITQSAWWKRLFARWARLPAWAPAAIAAALVTVPTLVTAARFHPYELTYFNLLVGGPRGAERLGFDAAYLKQEVNQQVLDEINRRLPPNAELWSNYFFEELPLYQQANRLRADIKLVPRFPCTYILIYARKGWMHPYEIEMMKHPEWAVWKLEHHGVVLVALYEVEVPSDGSKRVRIVHGAEEEKTGAKN